MLLLVFFGVAAAQSLTDVLLAQNSSLSLFNSVWLKHPEAAKKLNSLTNVTFLAPSNNAIQAYLNTSGSSSLDSIYTNKTGRFVARVDYHLLRGIYYTSYFTTKPAFIATDLDNTTYDHVTGGQRVEGVATGTNVSFISGFGENSTVVTPNVNFTSGTVHIIDTLLTVPQNLSDTLIAANLTAAAGALTVANDTRAGGLDSSDMTYFVPSNAGFGAVGNVLSNLTAKELDSVLKYHSVHGVKYSTDLQNGTLTASDGLNLTITVRSSGLIFVNSAKIIESDVLIKNGVMHIIDNVLNPANTTATANPTATTNPPAFSDASTSSGGAVPFTSGVQTPTSTAPIATHTTSTSTGLAVPIKTGAVGAAALFGVAAAFANL